MNSFDERAGWTTNAWRKFLSRDDLELNIGVVGHHQRSPLLWDGVPASTYWRTQVDLRDSSRSDLRSLNEFLSIQTFRALYNDNLTGLLHAPYLSTSLRSPIYSELLASKLETQLLVDKLLAGIGPPSVEGISSGPYAAELSAPFLLGIVLSRIQHPSEYWPAVGALRTSFAPLRRRLSQEREHWSGRSNVYLANYLRHLNGYMPDGINVGEQMLTATATAVATVATASPLGGAIAKLAIKLVSQLEPASHLYKWCLTRFRPDIAVVMELAEEANKLRSVEAEIARLWGSSWDRREHYLLENLAANRPEAFAKLRRLG